MSPDLPDEPRAGDIAVIGVGGRFPGARDVEEFWRRLRAGEDTITFFTDEELAAAGTPAALRDDPDYVRAGGVLTDPDPFHFDHEHFGCGRREAELMDPQHRLFLEAAGQLLDVVGHAEPHPDRPVGVFAGSSMNTYLPNVLARTTDLLTFEGTELMLTNDKDYLATRVSYKLGLTGPSLTVQTGCSTSLVAVHLAVQSLLGGECDLALAGGVSVHVGPYPGYRYREGLMFSPDGRCRAFDADAAGTCFGDGVGVVALRRLTDAVEAGDQVLAVIRGSAVNNDGSDKVGFSAPSVRGQVRAIVEAQAVAEVDPETVGYVEAHGTGTVLGDPIEFAALREAFGPLPEGSCALGSVKANVGHLAAAAGVTGLIKTVLALRYAEIPPHPHFRTPHPELGMPGSPFRVPVALEPWHRGDGAPRRAGVSSFGIGGTNAHLVLEEAPPPAPRPERAAVPRLLAVSARTPRALEELAAALADTLDAADAPDLADVAFTLRAGRGSHPYRRAVEATTPARAAAVLRAGPAAAHAPGTPGVALLFGDVPTHEPVPVPALERIARRDREASGLDATALGHPELDGFFTALALARLWLDSGVRPAVLAGSGAGALVAGCVSGALDVPSAAGLLAHRAGLRPGAPGLAPHQPGIPLLSAVTGTVLDPGRALDPAYWTRDIWTDAPGDPLPAIGEDRVVLVVGRTAKPLSTVGLLVQPYGEPAGGEGSAGARLLNAAGRLWAAGVPVDWTGWDEAPARRVPLPPHPLHRTRLVAPPAPAAPEPAAAVSGSAAVSASASAPVTAEGPEAAARTRSADPADWLYTESWQRLGPVTGSGPARQLDGRWLVFEDTAGVGTALTAALRASGATVTRVRAAAETGPTEDGDFTLDPADPDGHRVLFDMLRADGTAPDHIVHCWAVDGAPGLPGVAALAGTRDRGLHSLLDIARQAGRGSLTVLARHLYDVLGGEPLAPAKRPVTSAVAVIPQEFGHIAARCVDIGTDPVPADALLAEIAAGPTGTAAPVALRRGRRWARHFMPVPRAAEEARPVLRQGGVYLITGGLSGIGLTLAEHLAATYGASLVLTGRSEFPAPEEYDETVRRYGPEHPVSGRIARLRALAGHGGDVLTRRADVTDRERMAAVADEATARFGRVDGWFHAAGTGLDRASRWVRMSDRTGVDEAMAAKVHGALVLEEVFADRPLDFGCHISSLSSVLGGAGYAGYAAGNAVLDALAESVPGRFAIDWDAWRPDDTTGTPDAPDAERATASRELRALALTPDEGARAFALAMRHTRLGRVLVSTTDPAHRTRTTAAPPAPSGAAAAGPERARTPDDGGDLERTLARLWGEVLRTDIDRYDRTVFELGGDSMLVVELALRLEDELGVELGPTDVLQAPTVELLAARLRAAPDQDDEMTRAEERAARRSRGRAGRQGRRGN